MNKAHVTDLLSDFLEGGLSYANAEKVKAHLAFCNRCRQELEETKHQRAVLRTTPLSAPPAGLENRVLTAVRKEREQMPVQTGSGKFVWPSWFTPLRGLALAATCGIVLVVVRNLPKTAADRAQMEESTRSLSKDQGQAPVAIARREADVAQKSAPSSANDEKQKAEPSAPLAERAAGAGETKAVVPENRPVDKLDASKNELQLRDQAAALSAKPAPQPMTAAPAVPPVAPPAAAVQQAQVSANVADAESRLDSAPARLKSARAFEQKKVVPLPGVASGAGLQAAAPAKDTSVMEGSQSAIGTPRELVIKDKDVWQALWKEHMARVPNPPPAPDIDFEHQDVVAIFAGQRPTGGYHVVIDDIAKTTWNGEAARVVRYHIAGPPAGAVAAQVISTPFLFSIQPHFSGQTFIQKNR